MDKEFKTLMDLSSHRSFTMVDPFTLGLELEPGGFENWCFVACSKADGWYVERNHERIYQGESETECRAYVVALSLDRMDLFEAAQDDLHVSD